MRARFAATACALCVLFAGARAPAVEAPEAGLAQHPGVQLPLDAAFTDSAGRSVRLGDAFSAGGRAPAILVLGYARCPQLCGLLMQGLLEAAHATGLPADGLRFVFVSIDPQDTPADAAARRRVELAYARFLDASAAPPAIDVLVGPPGSIARVAQAVGARYAATPEAGPARFAHPAVAVVVTPQGRVSRYLMGVRFDAGELRGALVEASDGRIGGFSDRLALLCAHLDLDTGRWSAAVLQATRLAGLATVAALALLAWRLCGRTRAARGTGADDGRRH
jgi:protein SCO1/2